MTCEEFAQKVSDYLDDRVPFGERVGIWIHLIICDHCRRYLQQMRDAVDLMRETGESDADEECPSDVKEDLLDRFRERAEET